VAPAGVEKARIDGLGLLDGPALGQVRRRITALVAPEQAVVQQLGGGVRGPAVVIAGFR
jgi:hypothetical protein